MVDEIDGRILQRFEIQQKLGKGAFGIVWRVRDHETGGIFALKRLYDALQNRVDARRTCREINFLKELRKHENIIALHSVLIAANDAYLLLDYMESDLHAVIRANILKPIHQSYITYQILKALVFIHSAGVVHSDLKPSNLLIDSDCQIKVSDFALARLDPVNLKQTDDSLAREYVCARWYRAPEILLGYPSFHKEYDLWAVGCIIGEMILGKPVFPGSSSMNTIDRMMEVLGKPSSADLKQFSNFACTMMESFASVLPKPLPDVFPGAWSDALDVLSQFLRWNPHDRLSAEEALAHPYVSQFSNGEEVPKCSRKLTFVMGADEPDSSKGPSIEECRKWIESVDLPMVEIADGKTTKHKKKQKGKKN